MVKFSATQAWEDVRRMIAANRDVLLTVAGVFILVPMLAFSILLPAPEVPANMPAQEAMRQQIAFIQETMPFLLVVTAIELIGLLALIRLMADRARPTVAEAVKTAALTMPVLLGAQLLVGLGLTVLLSVLLVIGAAAGQAGATLAIAAGVVLFIVTTVRFALASSAIALEGTRNPLTALKRSWQLTTGNSGRVTVFLALILVAGLVVASVVMLLVGIVLALLTSGELQRTLAGLVWSAAVTVLSVYLIAGTVACWRQLAAARS